MAATKWFLVTWNGQSPDWNVDHYIKMLICLSSMMQRNSLQLQKCLHLPIVSVFSYFTSLFCSHSINRNIIFSAVLGKPPVSDPPDLLMSPANGLAQLRQFLPVPGISRIKIKITYLLKYIHTITGRGADFLAFRVFFKFSNDELNAS